MLEEQNKATNISCTAIKLKFFIYNRSYLKKLFVKAIDVIARSKISHKPNILPLLDCLYKTCVKILVFCSEN